LDIPPSLAEPRDRVVTPSPRKGRTFLIAGLVLLALVGGGFAYWLDARHYETTDDAFIDAHISQVSAQIGGRVTRLLVADNQPVKAGQVLAEIDPRDAQTRLDQMLAQRDQAASQLAQARAMLPVRQADLEQAGASIRVSQADALQNRHDLARYSAINPRAISAQQLDQARSGASGAEARLDSARHAEAGMRAQLAVARTQVDAAEAALRMADSNIAQARLQLSYTRVLAPADGHVARRTVELGNYVSVGQALLAIVQPDCWVTANLKESQLGRVHPGQPARVVVDAFPDRALPAHVDSVQRGTGAVFSSLPAENATGNYVKIVQRVPVKLVFDDPGLCTKMLLAPGMSVEPRITVQ
jgi:membrane fusion protein (multidrug efflux system)